MRADKYQQIPYIHSKPWLYVALVKLVCGFCNYSSRGILSKLFKNVSFTQQFSKSIYLHLFRMRRRTHSSDTNGMSSGDAAWCTWDVLTQIVLHKHIIVLLPRLVVITHYIVYSHFAAIGKWRWGGCGVDMMFTGRSVHCLHWYNINWNCARYATTCQISECKL